MGLRFLGFAAASGRIGIVYCEGNQLRFWKIARKAAYDPTAAHACAKKLIEQYQPDWVIIEDVRKARKKGARTKQIIVATGMAARESGALWMAVERRHDFKNKYEEAASLKKRHPQLSSINIKRDRPYDVEPKNTVVFEALSLVERAQLRPLTDFAAAMG